MTDTAPLPLGSRIGILGGGQLGRMLSLAASRLGMKTHIFCPDADSPAFEVTPHKTVANYTDEAALAAFADAVDVVTYEFENVPVETAHFLAARKALAPGARALEVAQDRLAEKAFLSEAGITVAPYRAVTTRADLDAAIAEIGLPAVLKTTRLGYDGKGQRTLKTEQDAAAAFEALSGVELVLEGFIPFEKEISVIAARDRAGTVRTWDPAENVHRNHILKTSAVPAAIAPIVATHAARAAKTILDALDYVGVMGIEFFVVMGGGRPGLLVNEIAPRVHNSGHWTMGTCATDQFENHIRAAIDWPLGDTTRFVDVEMENLLGAEVLEVAQRLGPGVQPHIYGKSEAREGRKMGHINTLTPLTRPE